MTQLTFAVRTTWPVSYIAEVVLTLPEHLVSLLIVGFIVVRAFVLLFTVHAFIFMFVLIFCVCVFSTQMCLYNNIPSDFGILCWSYVQSGAASWSARPNAVPCKTCACSALVCNENSQEEITPWRSPIGPNVGPVYSRGQKSFALKDFPIYLI